MQYIFDYNRNKKLLQLLEGNDTTPFYIRHLYLSLKNSCYKLDSAEKMLACMVISYHSIEKGLAMLDKRYGFGQKKMLELIKLCNRYLDVYGDYPSRITDTLGVIAEYNQLHQDHNFKLSSELQMSIDEILIRTKGHWSMSHTRHIRKEEYFEDVKSEFFKFSTSRHSVRDFDGTAVKKEIINDVLLLAQNAPSACNRQSTRIYVVYDEVKRKQLVELQNHGRGFADNANPLLVITTEMQDWGAGEQWFGGYLDAGIYTMNLLYALHYYKVAAVPLNWYADERANKKIHEILKMPDSQEVIAFVGCGNSLREFNLVTSKRRDVSEIVTYC